MARASAVKINFCNQTSRQHRRSLENLRRPRRFRNSLGILLGGLLATLTLSTTLPMQLSMAAPEPASVTTAQAEPLLSEGVHFYGQVPEPDQIGSGYIVFQSQGERVMGALYMPHSSFDCFQGRVEGGELAMQVTNSYTQEVYPYAIALVPAADAIADQGGSYTPLTLSGFHDLGAPRAMELELLETCADSLPNAEFEI